MSDEQMQQPNQPGGPSHLIAALSSRGGGGPQQQQQVQPGGGPIRVQLQQQGRAPIPYPQGAGGQPAPPQMRTVQQVYQPSSNGVPQQRIVHQIAQRPVMGQPAQMMRVSSAPQPTMQIVHTGPPPPQQIHVSSSPIMGLRLPPPQPQQTRAQLALLPGGQPPPPGTNVQPMLAPPSSNGSIMDRTRIDELARQTSANTVLDNVVKDMLCDYTDEFVNELVSHVCKLVKHRGNHRIEARDVEFVLDMVYKMPSAPRASVHVFGAPAPIRPDRITPQPTEAHKQRMLLIKKVATEADLIEALETSGLIAYVAIIPAHNMALVEFEDIEVRKSLMQALVEFESAEIAKKAKHAINGADIYSGCCTLKVELAKPDYVKVTRQDNDQFDFTLPNAALEFSYGDGKKRAPLYQLDVFPSLLGAASWAGIGHRLRPDGDDTFSDHVGQQFRSE
ncbi:unnamed protein product [Cylicocyclus nassatus]|uniref:Transcription initiation factor TFIID subunit 12 n=1 Tax=Cylicocyclus nassatus TaxID=53992 RepID=A0AA36HH17_CYLNA|nr:unnamed protein product [Cylicocyclus nassatus]